MATFATMKKLVGWKEIAGYLNRGIRTVQRYECAGCPIRRLPSGSVVAFAEELDMWLSQAAQPREVVQPEPALKVLNSTVSFACSLAEKALAEKANKAHAESQQLRMRSQTLQRDIVSQSRTLYERVSQLQQTIAGNWGLKERKECRECNS